MAKYNLNERQRQIVRHLVKVYEEGFEDEFAWLPTMGSAPSIVFWGKAEPILASETDLITLHNEGFVTLRREVSGSGFFGTLRQLAFDAMENDFEQAPTGPVGGSVMIGNFIQAMTGGNVQGAAGSHISMTQNIEYDMSALVQRFNDLMDQLTEVLTQSLKGSELRSAFTEIAAIDDAVKATNPDLDVVVKKSRSLGERLFSLLDIGDKTSGTIQTANLRH